MGPKAGRKTPELEKSNPDLGRGGEARLRQGFFLNPLSPRASSCRIGPRRPGREAAKRTLDGEDRSDTMKREGKGGLFQAFPQG